MLIRKANDQWVSTRSFVMALGTLGMLWILGSVYAELPAVRRYIRMARM